MNISQALELVQHNSSVVAGDYELCLEVLESHECWDHWFKCVEEHAKHRPDQFVEDQIRLTRVYLRYFDDIENASKCCIALIDSSGLGYEQFKADVLAKTLMQDEFAIEGHILQKAWEKFKKIEDRVNAVERLCYIYEKKIHNELMLNQLYERLLKLQPSNAKALRFFRTLNTQLQDWAAVVEILSKLLAGARHPQEGFRYAQEMAAVYLYQLEDPEMAISIIEEHCTNSTLDTSTIHYEAYYRLANYDGCLRVLRNCLLNIEDFHTRAVVHFRIGALYDQIGNLDQASENYEKSVELYPQFIEGLEGIISVGLRLKRWSSVTDGLTRLVGSLRSPILISQVQAGMARFEEGLRLNQNA